MDPQQQKQRQLVQAMLDRTGMKASRLAKAAGLNATTLTRFLNGQVTHALSSRTLARLSAASMVPVTYGPVDTMEPSEADAEQREDDIELAQWIADERSRKHWTQKALAALLNVPTETVSGWEAAEEQPSLTQLIDMCSAFGVSASAFTAPGKRYHGHILTDADEIELLALWRRIKVDDRGLVLRLVRSALSSSAPELDDPQRDGQLVDFGGS